MSLNASELLAKLVPQTEKTRNKDVGRRRHYLWAVPSETNSTFTSRNLSWWLLIENRAESRARNICKPTRTTNLYET